MIISYYGLGCFKIQSGETILAVDPYGKGKGFTPPRFEAHAVLLTNQQDTENFSLGGNPLVFATPGEYETRGISVIGFHTPDVTPFLIEWDGIRLLCLGELWQAGFLEPLLDHIDTIDILFISTAKASLQLQKIIANIDPRIIIPTETASAPKSSLDAFVKEFGGKPEKLDRLTIKQKGLPTEGRRLVILDAPSS